MDLNENQKPKVLYRVGRRGGSRNVFNRGHNIKKQQNKCFDGGTFSISFSKLTIFNQINLCYLRKNKNQ